MKLFDLTDINRTMAAGFVAEPLTPGTGHRWTLPTILGEMLADLESRYGPRDRRYTLLGIEFCGQIPMIWYPGNRKNVAVTLSLSTVGNVERAVWQLAHEAVHLLAPTGDSQALVVEEGLAVRYANLIADQNRLAIGRGSADSPHYNEAERLVREWLGDTTDTVKAIRAVEPCFSAWRPALLRAHDANISEEMARALCQPFASASPA